MRTSGVACRWHMYVVYVIRSLKDGKCYTGCTSDIEDRLKRHNAGRVRSTKNRRPFQLEYTEQFETLSEARKREGLLKKESKVLIISRGRAAR